MFNWYGYVAPPMRVVVSLQLPDKARKPVWKTVSAHGFGANAGRTNGMPWDGTSPVSAATVIDSHKAKTGQQTPKERARIIRTNPSE